MKRRELRIDIIRGIAMLTILLNHTAIPFHKIYSYHGPVIPTLTEYGYSSAASLFVSLSGYMVGMVYLRRDNAISLILARAWKLYLINAAILFGLIVFSYLSSPAHDSFWKLRPMIDPPFKEIVKFLTLTDGPAFTDILQLYVALMLATPVAIFLIKRSPILLAACSIGLWSLVQIAGFFLSPNGVPLSNGHSLNVLAWQLTFFLPMIAGKMKLHEPILKWFERQPKALLIFWGLLAISGIARELHAEGIVPGHYYLINRPLNGPVWLAHSLLVLGAYISLLTWLGDHLERWPFRRLASMGRNSLYVFVASTPIIYLASLSFGALGTLGYLLSIATVLSLSFVIAAWGDQSKQRKLAQQLAAQPQTGNHEKTLHAERATT